MGVLMQGARAGGGRSTGGGGRRRGAVTCGALLVVALAGGCGSDEDVGEPEDVAELPFVCLNDDFCSEPTVCDGGACAAPGQACASYGAGEAGPPCLSWEVCLEGRCEDSCALMGACLGGAPCVRGECQPLDVEPLDVEALDVEALEGASPLAPRRP